MSNEIQYKVGNLFNDLPAPSTCHITVIPHIVNDVGAWGSGFVVPLGERFPQAKKEYLRWSHYFDPNLAYGVGNCQMVWVDENVFVANMMAQHGTKSADNPTPIRYTGLAKCLETVAEFCRRNSAHNLPLDIYAPAFGSMRAGGDWRIIETLVKETLFPVCRNLFIYTLNEQERQGLMTQKNTCQLVAHYSNDRIVMENDDVIRVSRSCKEPEPDGNLELPAAQFSKPEHFLVRIEKGGKPERYEIYHQ